MKANFSIFFVFIASLLLTITFSCKKEPPKVIPTLTTTSVTEITTTTATSGGTVITDGGVPVTSRGVCWGLNQSPTILDSKTSNGSGTGAFTSSITSLSPGGTYYLRAYATNSVGTAYGSQETLMATPLLPMLTTAGISAITSTTATGGGNITSDGGSAVSERGICWSATDMFPTTNNIHTSNGTGTGIFSSFITGLTPGGTYYVASYATNSVGTRYGSTVTFTALAILPTIATSAVSEIMTSSVTAGGDVTSNGGDLVIARGICWSISLNPTISDSKTTVGTGNGIFTSSVTGLAANTRYNLRAYATNSIGTSYGSNVTFTTLPNSGGTLNDADGNVYHIVTIGTQVWTLENLKTTKYNDGVTIPNVTDNTAWTNLLTSAYCWYNNDISNKSSYGAIYNWYTVNTRKLCPTGWHVPSDTEWTTLTTYLGGESVAGIKLKENGTTHWSSPNTGATNESGFTALPGGFRNSTGAFSLILDTGCWWTSTEFNAGSAWYRYMTSHDGLVTRVSSSKSGGTSVRCIRD